MKGIFATVVALALLASACGSEDPKEHLRRGTEYAQQKKFPEAIVELRRAIQIEPASGEARAKLAEAYEAVGEHQNALSEAVRAADLLPNDPSAQLKAGNLLLASRAFDDARARAVRVLTNDPKNSEALILMGTALAGLGDFPGSLEQFEQAVAVEGGAEQGLVGVGGVALAQKQQDSAEKAFQQALAVNPKSLLARGALVNLYWNSQRFTDAERELKSLLELDPKNADANHALGLLYLATKRQKEAEPFLVTYADVTDGPAGQISLADYYVAVNRSADARRVLQRLSEDPSLYADAMTRLATMDIAERKDDEARRRVDAVLAKSPKHAPALVVSGQLLLRAKKNEEALQAANAALAEAPEAADAQLLRGNVYATLNRIQDAITSYEAVLKSGAKTRQERFEANFHLATLHLRLRAPKRALTYVQDALTTRPDSVQANFLAVRIDIARGELIPAKRRLAGLEKALPGSQELQLLRGHVEVFEKRPAAARVAFSKVLDTDPVNVEALAALNRLDMTAGKPRDAVTRIERTLQQHAPSADLLLLAAQAHMTAEPAKAETYLRSAIERDPNRADAYATLGQLYVQQKRLPEAIKQYEAMVQRDSNAIGASTLTGMLLEMSGQAAEAEKAYERTLAKNPRAAVAANNLAALFVETNRNLDRALQLAQTAQQDLPENPNVNDTLGWILVKKNLAGQAIRHLEFSAKAEPDTAVFHYHLGAAYLAAGDKVKARESLSRAMDLKLGGEDAARAKSLLASLRS